MMEYGMDDRSVTREIGKHWSSFLQFLHLTIPTYYYYRE